MKNPAERDLCLQILTRSLAHHIAKIDARVQIVKVIVECNTALRNKVFTMETVLCKTNSVFWLHPITDAVYFFVLRSYGTPSKIKIPLSLPFLIHPFLTRRRRQVATNPA